MGYFNKWFNKRIGIDLGTTNTIIYIENQGIVLCEPSVIAIDKRTDLPIAVGTDAFAMIGRTPDGIRASRPLRDGVVAELKETAYMLEEFLRRVYAQEGTLRNPEILITIPVGITSVERIAIQQIAERAKASRVYLPSEPLCAAIGADQPVTQAIGSMVVDIGGGTTEVAIISLSGIVVCESIRVAGDEIDDAIRAYLKIQYCLDIGEISAETIKMSLNTNGDPGKSSHMVALGQNSVTGSPTEVKISKAEIKEAIAKPLNLVADAVKRALERCPPELASDVLERGIILVGGGALLDGLEELISNETEVPVFIANDPLSCVALGAGKLLSDKQYRRLLELSLCA